MAEEKQGYNFDTIIPWHILKAHLKSLEKKVTRRMRSATLHEDMLRCQGELVLLDKLMNLPETLKITEDLKEQERKAKDG